MKCFSQLTQETLGYYVYLLINPLDNKIFYVGKGKGNRVFDHAKAISSDWISDKLDIIRSITDKGEKVRYYILRHGMTEKESYLVESAFIDFLTFSDFSFVANISNIVAGHNQWDKGLKTVEEIELLYNCLPLDVKNKPHNLLCININGTYHSSADIYEITRKSWVINPNRANLADYVVAEYRGIIRAIFKVNEKGWQRVDSEENAEYFKGKSKARYYFEGNEVIDEDIRKLYLHKRLPLKRKGQANPIQYLDIIYLD
ncbi:LEM-3-like GIY-YIG domain-containing protein [Dysgonomonas mossii]|uniref:LEM-3-like GIY-YIG domain-containing protein n=2 Tax=Dysgonomonas TaxID=156973 RepID=UPI00208ED029|nr:excinuclease ABC [Dysgonomonas mossii]